MLTMCSLVYLLLLLGPGFANLANASTLFLGPTDAALKFSTGWKKSKSTDSRDIMITENLGKALQINLPQNVTSMGYVGFTRQAGASYGVCVDCDAGSTVTLQTFQANTKDNGISDTSPTELFSMDLDPTVIHTIGVYNFPDPRFSQSGSLTFVSLRLNFDGPTSSSTSTISTQTKSAEGDETSTESEAPEPSPTETDDGAGSETLSGAAVSATAKPTSDSEDDDSASSGTATTTSAAPQATADDAGDDKQSATSEPTATSSDDENEATDTPGRATSTSVEPTSTQADDQDNTDADSEASDGKKTVSTSSSAAGAQATDSNGSAASGQSRGGDDPTDGATTTTNEPMSKALIAGIVILCVFATIALLVGVFFIIRTRRRRRELANGQRRDIEHNAGMVSVANVTTEPPPERPVNPFADSANVPLEFPMNSAMMPQRVIDFSSRPPHSSRTSSFGNVVLTAPYSPMRTSWINNPRPS